MRLLLLLSSIIWAQNEKLLRYPFLKKRLEKESLEVEKYKWSVSTPLYKLDINFDQLPEALRYVKRDGKDYIEVYSFKNKLLLNFKLPKKGAESKVYKIRYIRVAENLNSLLLFYYRGYSKIINGESEANLFLISFDDLFTEFKIFEGPPLFFKKFKYLGSYYSKQYFVDVEDLNEDGHQDVILSSGPLKRVLMLTKAGDWISLNNREKLRQLKVQ